MWTHDTNGHRDAVKDNAAGQEPAPGISAGSADNNENFHASLPHISPLVIYPLPKAQPRKTKGGR